jgi:hypothetical protein
MKKALLFGLIMLLPLTRAATQSMESKAMGFDFKGDQLGMSLDEFKTKHHDPGVLLVENTCDDRGKCTAPKQVWHPDMQCKEEGKGISTCGGSSTTVATIPASATFLFADGKLAAIRVSFTYSEDYFAAVQQALTAKQGTPSASLSGKAGSALFWDNGVSAVELQEHECLNTEAENKGGMDLWSKDLSDVLKAHYCAEEDSLTYHDSRIIYVHKTLGGVAQTRIAEAEKDAAGKAKSDI